MSSSEKSIEINSSDGGLENRPINVGGNNISKEVTFEEMSNEFIDGGSIEKNLVELDQSEFKDDINDFGGSVDTDRLRLYQKGEVILTNYIDGLEKEAGTIDKLDMLNKSNLKNLSINIIKEGGETNLEKMNKNLEQLNKNISNFSDKINFGGDSEMDGGEMEGDEREGGEILKDEMIGGEVNPRINEEYEQLERQKIKEHYKEIEEKIEEEILDEEQEQQELSIFDDFEDFEIDELSKEDVVVIEKDDENRLEYSEEVLFDNLVDVFRYNPDLMYNSDFKDKNDIKMYKKITISETSGKVDLPSYLYKSGFPPYIKTKYEGSGIGNNKSIYNFVNGIMYEKQYYKYEQNYKQKFVLNTFNILNNYRDYNNPVITPIILDKKMIFKSDYSEKENLENYTFFYNNQTEYLNSLIRFNPSKLGGSSNIKYLNYVREYNTIIRENYKLYNENIITIDNNVSINMDNLYVKDNNIILKDKYHDYIPNSINNIGNSIKNNNLFNYYNYNSVYRIKNKTIEL